MTQQDICDAINEYGPRLHPDVGVYATPDNLRYFSELFVADCLRAAREAVASDA